MGPVGGPRIAAGIAGLAAFFVFLSMAAGFIGIASVGAVPTGGASLTASAPQVAVSGLNLTVTVSGNALAGVVYVTGATVSIGGQSAVVAGPFGQSGSFTLPALHLSVPTYGSYAVVATVTATAPSTAKSYSEVSPVITATVARPASGGCSPNCPSESVSFTLTSAGGLLVNLVDHSTLTNSPQRTLIITWGDGQTATGSPGGVFSHSYAANGTFSVTDAVTGTNGSYSTTSSSAQTITVATGANGNSTITNNGAPPPPPAAPSSWFNPWIDAGLGVSIGVAFLGFTGWWKEGLVLIAGLGLGGFFLGPFL
jgi:hypothetical protein